MEHFISRSAIKQGSILESVIKLVEEGWWENHRKILYEILQNAPQKW
jgi:hypothetical protein